MTQSQPETVYLADYQAPTFHAHSVDMVVALHANRTLVTTRLGIKRQTQGANELILNGEKLELLEISVDGKPVPKDRYVHDRDKLQLCDLPDQCEILIRNAIDPSANSELSGLYLSNGMFCTQCEAEGFRRITFHQDRPDILATFKVRIEADKLACPVLLSNGNPVESGELGEGRHFALWHDPFPKPAYLFALVAGDLDRLDDRFQTGSGRNVDLHIYATTKNIDQCHFAMDALKRSMKWDEDVYGLEYDLDLFQIVAVDDFNMGAMENKGLNIFNAAAILASPDTATDQDYMTVERIIAHEYFHNWTGNRVTCRDWFQLTLKEGLTVFRDQQFSSDMHNEGVKRIGDVMMLREGQFAEDAGPLAHPIRPDSYMEINNFYTRTVYDKGAEVIRMIHTLIGPENYRKGIDLYFDRHDGNAVTCEDFVQAMQDASGTDLTQFMRWYRQAGTPVLDIKSHFDVKSGSLELEVTQTTPPTPGQPTKENLHIPLRMGLVGRSSGAALPLQLDGENRPQGEERVLELKDKKQSFRFIGLAEEPVPSLLHGFSAPVRINNELNRDEQAHLMAHGKDLFVRFEAGQGLALDVMQEMLHAFQRGSAMHVDERLPAAMSALLSEENVDPAFAARALSLPSRTYLAQSLPVIDVDGLIAVAKKLKEEISQKLHGQWLELYHRFEDRGAVSMDSEAIARRSMKNSALDYLLAGNAAKEVQLARNQYDNADNMTDQLAALRSMALYSAPGFEDGLKRFYEQWRHRSLVINKWFSVQAMIEDEDSLSRVEGLIQHPDFSLTNPNRLRSVVAVFAMANLRGFHRIDGGGYRLLRDIILELDPRNPQIAARLTALLGRWRRYDEKRRLIMQDELRTILNTPNLSRDSYEIASKSLDEK